MYTITRVKITNEMLDSMTTSIANDAAKLLGYNKLATVGGTNLMSLLYSLNISPLSTRSVTSYQASTTKKGMWSGYKWALLWTICCLVSLPLGVYFSANPSKVWTPMDYALAWTMTILAVTFAITALVMRFDPDQMGHRFASGWMSTSLGSYEGNVPIHTLDKAVSIAKASKSVSFSVEYLESGREDHPIPDKDPFLVAYLGDERVYIDVWDEREYEETL